MKTWKTTMWVSDNGYIWSVQSSKLPQVIQVSCIDCSRKLIFSAVRLKQRYVMACQFKSSCILLCRKNTNFPNRLYIETIIKTLVIDPSSIFFVRVYVMPVVKLEDSHIIAINSEHTSRGSLFDSDRTVLERLQPFSSCYRFSYLLRKEVIGH